MDNVLFQGCGSKFVLQQRDNGDNTYVLGQQLSERVTASSICLVSAGAHVHRTRPRHVLLLYIRHLRPLEEHQGTCSNDPHRVSYFASLSVFFFVGRMLV